MDSDDVTCEALLTIANGVGDRSGGDFSRLPIEREPVPWEYLDVASRCIAPGEAGLDIGTGG